MSSEIIQNVAYDNYDNFQHVNVIYSQYFISLFWRLFNDETDSPNFWQLWCIFFTKIPLYGLHWIFIFWVGKWWKYTTKEHWNSQCAQSNLSSHTNRHSKFRKVKSFALSTAVFHVLATWQRVTPKNNNFEKETWFPLEHSLLSDPWILHKTCGFSLWNSDSWAFSMFYMQERPAIKEFWSSQSIYCFATWSSCNNKSSF